MDQKTIKMNIPLSELNLRKCKCGGSIFIHALSLRIVPALYSPSGKPETIVLPIGFTCVACGEILSLVEGEDVLGSTDSDKESEKDSKPLILSN